MSQRSRVARAIAPWLLLALAAGVGARAALPEVIRWRIQTDLKKACPRCELSLGTLELRLSKGEARLGASRYRNAPETWPKLDVQLSGAELSWESASFLHGPLHFRSLRVEKPVFVLTERASQPRKQPRSARELLGKLPSAILEHLTIQDGQFVYRRIEREREAALAIGVHEASVGEFATRSEFSPTRTKLRFRGSVDEQGAFDLETTVELFARDNRDRYVLDLRGVDLSKVGFFRDLQGLQLQGRIEEARVDLLLHQGDLEGTFEARYRDLAVKCDEKSLVVKLFSALLLWHDQPTKPDDPMPLTRIAEKRRPKESFIALLLRGMKDGALDLARGKGEEKRVS